MPKKYRNVQNRLNIPINKKNNPLKNQSKNENKNIIFSNLFNLFPINRVKIADNHVENTLKLSLNQNSLLNENHTIKPNKNV